jgi:hypothetical protein
LQGQPIGAPVRREARRARHQPQRSQPPRLTLALRHPD